MTNVYIIRHCETKANAEKKLQGHIDIDINELGAKQLQALSERFKSIDLNAVFTSPLLRAKRTAEAVAKDKNIPIKPLEGLIELNCGVYEGRTYAEIGEKFPDFFDIWFNRPWDFAPENGEKMTDAYERIWQTVTDIVKSHKGQNIAIVSHGGVVRCLLCKVLKNDITKLCELPFSENTAVSLLTFSDNMEFDVVYFNDSSHLRQELKNKNANIPGEQ